MAIFESVLFSKLRKSVGNITMYELNGENIVRGKYSKRDIKSPEQLAQRARMKKVKKLSYDLWMALHTGFPAKNRSISINKFVSRNIGLMNPDEEYRVTYDVTQLKLSSGELLPPKVSAVINREAGTVTFTQERQPLRPLAPDDDRVYGVVWGRESRKTQVFPLRLRCEPGSTVATLKTEILEHPLEVYAFTVSGNGKKASETIWITGEQRDENE